MNARTQFETHENLQFYPTPKALALEAWSMFTEKNITRLLEPSAGRGDLVATFLDRSLYDRRLSWDAVEIDASHHPLLRDRGAQVVGYDFLAHTSCAIYSHIIMNPPFAQGAKHLLHAWNTLYDGEIVAIINAETLRNQCTVERGHLARIIANHGEVRFIEDAFQGNDVYRTAQVEIALVHLTKRADTEWLKGSFTEGLVKDRPHEDQDAGWQPPQELALPAGFVEDTVRNFDIALAAAKDYAKATAKFGHYSARLGQTFEAMQNKGIDAENRVSPHAGQSVRNTFIASYQELKSAAWGQILRSTHVLSRLSDAARRRVESEFENIKALEFTVANVYGFLTGLVNSAGEIQMGMVCDVFDKITRYHTENTVYYMGWKSNDKHRTAGMRIKRSRFILPGETHQPYRSTASYDIINMMRDFDRVFAMLDGKSGATLGLVDLFERPDTFKQLVDGERLSSDYFDVRYYRGRGTIHFFPRSQEVIERLNRTIGKHRNWLPPSDDQANEDFHVQYEKAEKLHAEILDAFAAQGSMRHSYYGFRTLHHLTSQSQECRDEAEKALCQAMSTVLERHDLHPQERVASESNEQRQLAMIRPLLGHHST